MTGILKTPVTHVHGCRTLMGPFRMPEKCRHLRPSEAQPSVLLPFRILSIAIREEVMGPHTSRPLDECVGEDQLRNKYSTGGLSDFVWADEPADLFLSQVNIITGHYNLSGPNARNRCSGVLQPQRSGCM